MVVTHPIAREEKPHPDAKTRNAEHHLLRVALSRKEEADYRRTIAAGWPTQWLIAQEVSLPLAAAHIRLGTGS